MSTDPSETSHSALTCFVIGPIGSRLAALGTAERQTYEDALKLMETVIEPACEANGLSPVRADNLARAGEITEQIFRRLRDDDVVIADLTGANANVMYELGLRHTRGRLTVQIGEYGRLPFDINTIRTIQFSPSPVGLINARDELTTVLAAGLAGEYDPVSATRVWNEEIPTHVPASVDLANAISADEGSQESGSADDRGFLDIVAEGEARQDELEPALEAIGERLTQLGELANQSTEEMRQSDSAGRGMRGRLQVATRYATRLDEVATRLKADVEYYSSVLGAIADATAVMIGRLEEEPELLEQEDGKQFGMVFRQIALVTRETMGALAGMTDAVEENAKLSRVLREPSRKLTTALDQFAAATSVADEWDRRLQSLGVPVPPIDWDPDGADSQPSADEERSDGESEAAGGDAVDRNEL